ncbi:MAG: hypothetical protein ACE5FR_05470 [Rhodospirillales bacterium]
MVQIREQAIFWPLWPTVWPRVPATDAPGRDDDAAATSFNVSVGIVGAIVVLVTIAHYLGWLSLFSSEPFELFATITGA